MGTAVAWPLADNGHEVRLVGTHLDAEIIRSCLDSGYHPRLRRQLPGRVTPFYVEDLPKALEGADLIVSGVNSLGVHWIGRTLGPLLWPGATVIAVTKGLEASREGSPRILPDVLRDELPLAVRDQVTLAAIGGPCIAGELAGRRHSCVVFTSRDAAALERLQATFATDYYHIWTSTDIIGVEVCAALRTRTPWRSAWRPASWTWQVGRTTRTRRCTTLRRPSSARAREMTRIVTLMGGSAENVAWLPGVGDQYVTCAGGRTIRLGRLLGAGLTYTAAVLEMAGETLEGAYVIKQLAQALPVWEARGLLDRRNCPCCGCSAV